MAECTCGFLFCTNCNQPYHGWQECGLTEEERKLQVELYEDEAKPAAVGGIQDINARGQNLFRTDREWAQHFAREEEETNQQLLENDRKFIEQMLKEEEEAERQALAEMAREAERAQELFDADRKWAEQLAKEEEEEAEREKEIEEERRREERARLERQRAEERARQEADVERQRTEENARRNAERQRAEERGRQRVEMAQRAAAERERKKAEDAASENLIKNAFKKCPRCQRDIEVFFHFSLLRFILYNLLFNVCTDGLYLMLFFIFFNITSRNY